MEKDQFRAFCMGLLWGIGGCSFGNQIFGTHFSSADKILVGLLLGAALVLLSPVARDIDIYFAEKKKRAR